jgi:hypothetical protein
VSTSRSFAILGMIISSPKTARESDNSQTEMEGLIYWSTAIEVAQNTREIGRAHV